MSDFDSIDADEETTSWDQPKVRTCLRCETDFESSWSGERICKRCKSSNSWKSSGYR